MLANKLSTDWNFALVGAEETAPAGLDGAAEGAGVDGPALGCGTAGDAAGGGAADP